MTCPYHTPSVSLYYITLHSSPTLEGQFSLISLTQHYTIMTPQPYTKSELATMYFPIGSTSNALRRLNRYINHAHGLLPALLATGYRVNDRHFTRRQVQLIFEYLGEP